MQRLLNYINNLEDSEFSYMESLDIAEMTTSMHELLVQQFLQPEEHNIGGGNLFRASALDKPTILLAWLRDNRDKLQHAPVNFKAKSYFLSGVVFEMLVYYLLRHLGYEVETQTEVAAQVGDYTVTGHVDFVCYSEDEPPFIVETKEWGSSKFERYASSGVSDTTHLTQIAIYSKCLGIPCLFVGGNRDTRELTGYIPDESTLDGAIDTVTLKLSILSQCSKWEDVVQYVPIPPGIPETYKKKYTGRYYVPYSMRPYWPIFYDCAYEPRRSGTGYSWFIQDYRYPPQYEHLKPKSLMGAM